MKTTAHRRYKDDVPDHVKKERHNRMIQLYRRKCQELNQAEVGNTHLVLVEGTVKKTGQILGRNELYIKVVFDQTDIPTEVENADYFEDRNRLLIDDHRTPKAELNLGVDNDVFGGLGGKTGCYSGAKRRIEKGDYVAVKIVAAKSSVLSAVPLYHTSLTEFYRYRSWADRWDNRREVSVN